MVEQSDEKRAGLGGGRERPIDEAHLSWLLGMMPHAKSPEAYGPSFGDDIQFSPVIRDEDGVRKVAETLGQFGEHARGAYFGVVSPGVYQLHVIFATEHAKAARFHYGGEKAVEGWK